MNNHGFEKGKIDISLSGPVPIVNPRLMRTVPSNIGRIIGNFDEVDASSQVVDTKDCLAEAQ